MINGHTNGADHQVHSDRSQHNVGGEQTNTVEGASNAIASLDAVKSNTDEGQGGKTPVDPQSLDPDYVSVNTFFKRAWISKPNKSLKKRFQNSCHGRKPWTKG